MTLAQPAERSDNETKKNNENKEWSDPDMIIRSRGILVFGTFSKRNPVCSDTSR